MDSVIWPALLATAGTWLITAIGAATVVFFRTCDRRIMNWMMGFAAGVMIAAGFWSLLLPAVQRAQSELTVPAWAVVTAGLLGGMLFMWGSDKIIVPLRAAKGDDAPQRRRIRLLVLSITLHNIPEGLAVGVAFGALHGGYNREALMGAITVAVGIGLQNFPEGAAVSLPLRREGYSRARSFWIGQASGMVEPVAGVIGAAAVLYMQRILPFALAFAAGAMMLVAVHELIPECQQEQAARPYLATTGIMAGFTLMTLLDVALG